MIIYVSNLFRGSISAWYDPLPIRCGLVVAFTGLHVFSMGVFHHPVWFVCLVGVFYVTSSWLIYLTPLGRLNHWRDWRPPSIRSDSSSALSWRVFVDPCSLGRCSSLGEFHGVLYRKVPSTLIWTGCFFHPLCRTAAQGNAWTFLGNCWTQQDWFSCRRDSFWLSD